jgi:isoamylase
LTAYEHRHNEDNQEDNRDGHGENLSRNWGIEGPSDDPQIQEIRRRVRRSMLLTLLGSHGTPMLLGGDEFGRSQRGNNNAYCQDNELSWFDWKQANTPEGEAMIELVRRLIDIRKRHPLLRSRSYLYGEEMAPGLPDIDWWDERGMRLDQCDWDNNEGRALVMRLAQKREDGRLDIVCLLLNSSPEALVYNLPPPNARRRLLIDSAHPEVEEHEIGDSYYLFNQAAAVIAWTAEAE